MVWKFCLGNFQHAYLSPGAPSQGVPAVFRYSLRLCGVPDGFMGCMRKESVSGKFQFLIHKNMEQMGVWLGRPTVEERGTHIY